MLEKEYDVIMMDFQTFGSADFATENIFALSFANTFLRQFKKYVSGMEIPLKQAVEMLEKSVNGRAGYFTLKPLFEELGDICEASEKPIVLMIDEVDSASNNQVFLDFLGAASCTVYQPFSAENIPVCDSGRSLRYQKSSS